MNSSVTPGAVTRPVRRRSRGALLGLFSPLYAPKPIACAVLLAVAVAAVPGNGGLSAARAVAVAVAAAVVVDLVLGALRGWGLVRIDGAVITGAIVGLVLTPTSPLVVCAVVGAAGIVVKHLVRVGRRHVFNPAAVALAALALAGPILGGVWARAGQSWWGAAGRPAWLLLPVVLVAGLWIADRVRRLPAVGAFLAVYFALLGFVLSMVPGPVDVGRAYRPPFVQATVFFAVLMVTDPATSPGRFVRQLQFGSLIAVASAIAFSAAHQLWFLTVALLVGNLWFAVVQRRSTTAASAAGAPARQSAAPACRANQPVPTTVLDERNDEMPIEPADSPPGGEHQETARGPDPRRNRLVAIGIVAALVIAGVAYAGVEMENAAHRSTNSPSPVKAKAKPPQMTAPKPAGSVSLVIRAKSVAPGGLIEGAVLHADRPGRYTVSQKTVTVHTDGAQIAMGAPNGALRAGAVLEIVGHDHNSGGQAVIDASTVTVLTRFVTVSGG